MRQYTSNQQDKNVIFRQHCENQGVPIISPQTESFLQELCLYHTPHRIIEIGSAIGYSTLFLATQCVITHSTSTITSFDVSIVAYREAMKNIGEDNALSRQYSITSQDKPHITIYPFDITQISPACVLFGTYDFVFLDARKILYGDYIMCLLPYINDQTVIVCDDMTSSEKKMQGLYSFLDKMQWHWKRISLGDGDSVLITGPNANYIGTIIDHLAK